MYIVFPHLLPQPTTLTTSLLIHPLTHSLIHSLIRLTIWKDRDKTFKKTAFQVTSIKVLNYFTHQITSYHHTINHLITCTYLCELAFFILFISSFTHPHSHIYSSVHTPLNHRSSNYSSHQITHSRALPIVADHSIREKVTRYGVAHPHACSPTSARREWA